MKRRELVGYLPIAFDIFELKLPVFSGLTPFLEKNMTFAKNTMSEKPRIKMHFLDATVFCSSQRKKLRTSSIRPHGMVHAGLESVQSTPAYESAIRFSLFESDSRW